MAMMFVGCLFVCGMMFVGVSYASLTYFGDLLRCPHKRIVTITLHYTKIGDAGGVPLQRCEPSKFWSAHYTKIGDAGVRRRGLWTSLGSGPR